MDERIVRVAGIVEDSTTDGPGFRMAIFAQGCFHDCEGCHNPKTHPLEWGTPYTVADLQHRFTASAPHLAGLTLSGGEPFLQASPLAAIARTAHELGRDVMTYTGYTYEALLRLGEKDAGITDLLRETDVLVDGPFLLAHRDLSATYRGSTNQRILKLVAGSVDLEADITAELS